MKSLDGTDLETQLARWLVSLEIDKSAIKKTLEKIGA